MRKILTYFSLVIASLAVIALFVTSVNYLQLVVASILYPILVYLIYKILPPKVSMPNIEKPATAILQPVNAIKENKGIADFDKRSFLKVIGAAGISFFLFSIFSKRSTVPFFGTLTGGDTTSYTDSNGNKINPAEHQPTDGYRISEIDDNDISYYGFTNKDGGWFIMKEGIEGSFRYVKGESNFTGNWADREVLKYDYYHNVF